MKVFLIFIAISSTCYFGSLEASQVIPAKAAAFKVLVAKCNTCHQKKNPRKVFQLYNMEGLAPKIYKQVFVKKRMPKGKKNNLSQAEYATLEKWIFSLNINQ